MKTRKVIHVELKEPGDRPKHFYFGSKKAVYDVLSNEEVNHLQDSPELRKAL